MKPQRKCSLSSHEIRQLWPVATEGRCRMRWRRVKAPLHHPLRLRKKEPDPDGWPLEADRASPATVIENTPFHFLRTKEQVRPFSDESEFNQLFFFFFFFFFYTFCPFSTASFLYWGHLTDAEPFIMSGRHSRTLWQETGLLRGSTAALLPNYRTKWTCKNDLQHTEAD